MTKEAEQAYAHIHLHTIPDALSLFHKKTLDYSHSPAFLFLGSKGQFSDMNRKFWKLYASVWEGHQLTGEQPREIVQDMIGHCFLLLYCLEKEEQA